MTNEEVKNALKDKLLADLVDTVEKVTNNSWNCEESENQTNAILSVMSGGLPVWFTQALAATKTIMQLDEMQGLECLAALHFSTRRASEEQKLSAVSQIVQLISIAPSDGLGILPFGGALRGI